MESAEMAHVYSVDGTNASGNSGSNNPEHDKAAIFDMVSVEGVEEVSVVKGVIPAEYANGW